MPQRLPLRQKNPARILRRTATDAERELWYHLRNRRLGGHKFRRQSPVGAYVADFACIEARVIVELDGGQHFDPESMAADARRTAAMEEVGFHIMRFTNREVLLQMEAVLEAILQRLTLWELERGPRKDRG